MATNYRLTHTTVKIRQLFFRLRGRNGAKLKVLAYITKSPIVQRGEKFIALIVPSIYLLTTNNVPEESTKDSNKHILIH